MFILAGVILFIHFGWSHFIHSLWMELFYSFTPSTRLSNDFIAIDRSWKSTFHEVWSIIFSRVAVYIGSRGYSQKI